MSAESRYAVPHAVFVLSLLLASASPAASTGQLLEARDFRLGKDAEERIVFSVARDGLLVVRARIKKPLPGTPVGLRLEGPEGLRVEKTGQAPLRLRYEVTGALEPQTWHASVINVSKLPGVTGELTVELEDFRRPAKGRPGRGSGPVLISPPDPAELAGDGPFSDGKVTTIDHRHLRVVCRDRNSDVSLRLDLDQGTGVLLLRTNHVFSVNLRETPEDLIEIRGSGQHPLFLDLGKEAIFLASGEKGTFCRVRIYYGEGR